MRVPFAPGGAGLSRGVLLLAALVCGCSPEARDIGPSLPQTPPISDSDPRIPAYQDNFYQVAQGGRYFAWYGCSGCHRDGSPEPANLADGRWQHGGGFGQVYRAIANRHGAHAQVMQVPIEQLWQLTAYVRDLPQHTPEKRRRLELDQRAEAQGSTWSGPQ